MTYIGFFFITMGIIAFIIGAIGLLRMPDVYTRMHVGAKAPTVGTLFVIIGAMCLEPGWSLKLLLLGVFILLTNPLSSSVIARASHKIGISVGDEQSIDELKSMEKEVK